MAGRNHVKYVLRLGVLLACAGLLAACPSPGSELWGNWVGESSGDTLVLVFESDGYLAMGQDDGETLIIFEGWWAADTSTTPKTLALHYTHKDGEPMNEQVFTGYYEVLNNVLYLTTLDDPSFANATAYQAAKR